MKELRHYFLEEKIHHVPPNNLRGAEENPRIPLRLADPERFKALSESITRGFFSPILVEGETLEIVGGHQRVDAARELGLDTVPVLFLKKLTDEEKVRIRIADNTTAGAFDLPRLTAQMELLPPEDHDLLMLDAMTLDNVTPLDLTPETPDEPQKWEKVSFRLTIEAANRVNGIIKEFCERNKCKPGTALERILEDWQLDPNSHQDT